MEAALPNRVRIGAFEFDLKAGELRSGDRNVRLQEQPFQILLILLERSDGLVTREEIQRKLWPNDTVVEFDHSIHTAISKLRQALGDSAEHPKYIETVARRGYRLMVPVERVDASPASPPPEVAAPPMPGPPASSLIGKKVSNYRILELLAAGGMGVVYKAEDLKLGRRVALKFLPQELVRNSLAVERFEREARAASALNHPHICTIYEVEEHEGQPFIVMELLDGQTLRERIGNSRAPLETNDLIDLAIQITDGLDAAHQKGIIHRDIKTANIFLTNRGQAKILDFGLAKIVDLDEHSHSPLGEEIDESFPPGEATTMPSLDSTLTRAGAMIGTVSYMSPEQVRGEKLDSRTDLFSFGLVLYEMATGQRAFRGSTAIQVNEAILHRTPAPARDSNAKLPPGLELIIDKALQKEREMRYQSAAEIRTDLQTLRRDTKTGSNTSETIQGNVLSVIPWWRSKLAAGIGGFLFVCMIPAVAFYAHRVSVARPSGRGLVHSKFTFTGDAYAPAISPDGLFVAYVLRKPGEREKLIVQASNGAKVELAQGTILNYPRWSSDGSEVLFFRNELALGKADHRAKDLGISVVSRLGGVARPIFIAGLACWLSPDGSEIVTTASGAEPVGFNGVRIVNKFTGEAKEVHLSDYKWLIDIDCSARAGLILAVTETSDKYQIRTFKPDGSDERKLGEHSDQIYSARWSPTGDAIYYLHGKGSTKQLSKLSVTRSDAKPVVLADGLQTGEYFTVSADASRLAYTRQDHNSNLWRVDLPTGEKRAKPEISRLTSGTSYYGAPSFSPDGHWIAFALGPNPDETNIFKTPVASGEPVQLTFFEHATTASPAWSPDGQRIAFIGDQNGTPRVWMISANGGAAQPLQNTNASDTGNELAWWPSSDIIYQQTGVRNYLRINEKTHDEKPIIQHEQSLAYLPARPVFSPDGKKMAVFWNRKDNEGLSEGLSIISLEPYSEMLLLSGFIFPVGWSPDGKYLYAIRLGSAGQAREIIRVRLASPSEVTSVATLPGDVADYDSASVSSDGHQIIVSLLEDKSDVWLMENFDPAQR